MARRRLGRHLWWIPTIALVLLAPPVVDVVAGRSTRADSVTAMPAALQFFDLINQYRSSKGLAVLVRDAGLDGVAGQWSADMATVFAGNGGIAVSPTAPKDCTVSALCHRSDLAAAMGAVEPAWTQLAENLGVGGDVVGLYNGFVASPLHEANMVGPYNRVGVGVTVVGDRIWVTMDFLAGPVLAAVATALPIAAAAPAPVTVVGGTARFMPAAPQRLLDTRDGTGGRQGVLGGGSSLALAVAGVGPVPPSAMGVVVNVTATNGRLDGYLTVYPCGAALPTASNVNFRAGTSVPNLVIVPLGGGSLCVFSNATTDVVVDLAGWYTTGAGSSYTVRAPSRVLDSRSGPPGQWFTVALGASVAVDAVAATLNLTIAEPAAAGYITAYPCGGAPPLVSNANFVANETVANRATVPIGADRSVCVYSSVPTDLIVDLSGAYGSSGSPVTLVVPERLLDTRDGTGGWSGVLGARQTIDLVVGGAAGIPAIANAVAFNVTVTNTDTSGFLTVYACGGGEPLASNLNYVAGDTRANLVTVPVGTDGKVCFYTNGHTAIVADIAGYAS